MTGRAARENGLSPPPRKDGRTTGSPERMTGCKCGKDGFRRNAHGWVEWTRMAGMETGGLRGRREPPGSDTDEPDQDARRGSRKTLHPIAVFKPGMAGWYSVLLISLPHGMWPLGALPSLAGVRGAGDPEQSGRSAGSEFNFWIPSPSQGWLRARNCSGRSPHGCGLGAAYPPPPSIALQGKTATHSSKSGPGVVCPGRFFIPFHHAASSCRQHVALIGRPVHHHLP